MAPWKLKIVILPYDEVDFEQILDVLAQYGFVVKYEHEGQAYGVIPTFLEHQYINQRESKSKLPTPPTCVHVRAYESFHIPHDLWENESSRGTARPVNAVERPKT